MQIGSISNINFESKYFLSDDAKEGANALLIMMKKSTVHRKNSARSGWSTEILSSLNMDKNIKFTNARLFTRLTGNPELDKTIPDCSLKIGKNQLNINITTGEVVSHKTGFFTSMNNLIAKAESCIKKFLDNFNNPDIVKKNTFETGGHITLL